MSDPWAECREILRVHSKSFHLASRLFPRARRDEVGAVYAWCRTCDDAIDLAPPARQAAALEELRRGLSSIYAGEAQADPVACCFQEVVRRRRIPVEYPRDLLAGMEMDVRIASYPTVDELLVYCWRVAGVVGMLMCHVMGVSDPSAARHAAHLGIAMQLTNICRDVLEDRVRGRVYLPAEWLGPDPALAIPAAVRRLLALAERYYASADRGLAYLEPRSALAVRTARLVYAEIGREIERRDFDVLSGRAVVPARTRLRLAARALRRFAADRRAWRAAEVAAPADVLRCADAVRLA